MKPLNNNLSQTLWATYMYKHCSLKYNKTNLFRSQIFRVCDCGLILQPLVCEKIDEYDFSHNQHNLSSYLHNLLFPCGRLWPINCTTFPRQDEYDKMNMPCGTSTTKTVRHCILLSNKNESFSKSINVVHNGQATAYSVSKIGSIETITCVNDYEP